MMVGFERVPGTVYQMKTKLVPIKEVMLYERKMPDNFINERGNDVTQEFVDWCRPLIGDPLPIPEFQGLSLKRKIYKTKMKMFH
ncbi:MAG: hypothetical protein ACLTER_24080 [Ruminococcus sp.]